MVYRRLPAREGSSKAPKTLEAASGASSELASLDGTKPPLWLPKGKGVVNYTHNYQCTICCYSSGIIVQCRNCG